MTDRRTEAVLAVAVAVLAAAVIGLLLLSISLDRRVAAAKAEAEDVRDELARVEEGAAAAALQLSALTGALEDSAPEIDAQLDQAVADLEAFAGSTIAIDIDVSEVVPIETSLDLNRELIIPIRTSIPIDETIDTTITVAGPLNTEIPLDVTVPVNLDLPVELDVPILVEETIPISAQVPIDVTVPIEIEVSETELAAMASSLGSGLEALRSILSSLGAS